MMHQIFKAPAYGIRKIWVLSLIFFSSLEAVVLSINTSFLDVYTRNYALLKRSPDYEWCEHKNFFSWGSVTSPIITKGCYQAKGSAGVIPYVEYNSKLYVLLGKEAWGKDAGTYCELGGAVDVYSGEDISVDSFLDTLLKESREESGYLYELQQEEVLDRGHVFSYTYHTKDFYNGFEGVFAFCKVDVIYFSDQLIAACQSHVQDLISLNLCPWGFQEKERYEWIELEALDKFLQSSKDNSGFFYNILGEYIEICFRPHFIVAMRSEAALAIISSLKQRSLSLLEET